ncbi:MAG: hypothetical protein ACK4PN_08540 [Allorhizobium sp.]
MSDFDRIARTLHRQGFRECYINIWALRTGAPRTRFTGDPHSSRGEAIAAQQGGHPVSSFVAYRIRVRPKPGMWPS